MADDSDSDSQALYATEESHIIARVARVISVSAAAMGQLKATTNTRKVSILPVGLYIHGRRVVKHGNLCLQLGMRDRRDTDIEAWESDAKCVL